MTSIYFNILDILGDYYAKYKKENLTVLKDAILYQVEIICKSIRGNVHKVSQQQQADVEKELKRMKSIINLAKIISNTIYMQSKNEVKVQRAYEKAQNTILSWHVFDNDAATNALKDLQETTKLSAVVSIQERNMVVKAMGFKAGHWFKCPNNHYYCIGECGGAMQTAKCIECGLPVGGTNHSLLRSNRHAGEMDGSSFPAWSEEYNNLRNFELDI